MFEPSPIHPTDQPRIMVAEDDPDMAHVISFLLRREGFHVDLVPDGREALRLIADGSHYDLVLLDVMMPYLSGLHVVREVRGLPGWEQTPIIMVSGKASEADVVVAIEAGADDYVVKPFRPKELMARVRGLLQRHRHAAGRVA